MEKVLVDVFVPATEESYDIYLPLGIHMGEAVLLVSKVASDLSENQFIPSEDCMFFDPDTGDAYDNSKKLVDLPIFNGTRLMLI